MKRLLSTITILLILQASIWAQNDQILRQAQDKLNLPNNYKMAGPYEVIARDGQYRNSKGGSERDMKAALELSQHEEGYAQARTIINAYADKLQRLDGHDAPLCLIQGFDMVQAMLNLKTSPKGISAEEKTAWSTMLRRAMMPTMDKFEADSPYANGNWGAIVNRFRMAAAIFMDDEVMYKASVDYFMEANDNGALPRYISETGQCQETGRDQAHAQLGLEAQCQICELAWKYKHDDLWGAFDNRLLKGIEYSAKYNLGYDVPFTTWTDCTGLYNDWTEPGAMSRGKLWDIYQLPYEHYHNRKGLNMPYTEKVLALQAKAEAKGESREVRVKGVKEGTKLHQVFTYAAPDFCQRDKSSAPLKNDYDVFIQPRGSKEWKHIDTYMAKVNAPTLPPPPSRGGGENGTGHKVSEISYCFFDFTGDVFVKVVSKNRKFKSARIRPDYRGTIANVQNDSTVQFLLFQPENVSMELDGDIRGNLLVFTSKPTLSKEEAAKEAKRQKRNFTYYPAGHYTINNGQLTINNEVVQDNPFKVVDDNLIVPSNTTLYLAGGAYFEGTFAIDDAENVSILGRGIARPARGYEGCHVHRSKNVLIDGLILNTCPVGGSDGVTLHDVRSISHPSWGDGLNVFASSNVLYDRVFCRNSDDCTTAYATRKGFSGSARNIRMRNSTLWADVAHPIFIGIHGAAAGPNPELRDTIENLVYENIDILCQSEPQVDYQGCLAINCGDNNLVRNVTFDNIRIENLNQGSLIHVKVGWNQKYCKAPGLGVEDITFRNIRYNGASTTVGESVEPYMSVINGYNEQRKVRNITFEGLKINGRHIHDTMPGKPAWYSTSDYVPLFIGNHVENVTFR